jgi:soluble P-type ATPase
MISLEIPGFGKIELEHLVLDYNGTLALDGELLPGVADALRGLSSQLEVHVLTADTFGTASSRLAGIPCRLSVLPTAAQDAAKAVYVRSLGAEKTACIGNGRNDRRMTREARLGIAVLGGEGAAYETLAAADVVVTNIRFALELLVHPLRIIATLRS